DRAPAAIGGALGHEHAGRLGLGPMMQTIGDPHRIVAELHLRPSVDDAVAAVFDRDVRIAERDRAQRGHFCNDVGLGAHKAGFTLAVLRSRNALIRRFASLSLCATVAISDSINSPVCGLASAIIGSACSTAKLVNGAFAATLVASSIAL